MQAVQRSRRTAITARRFPAHTSIQTSRTTSISALRVGDVVLAFDARADKGRGALVPRRVTRLYRNTTTDWIRLRWFDGAQEGVTTPGHHFLDEFGQFPITPKITHTGSATVVLAWGVLTQVTAERIAFCADTAPLFERAVGQGVVAGNAEVKVGDRDGWATGAVERVGLRGCGRSGVVRRGRKGRRMAIRSFQIWTAYTLSESKKVICLETAKNLRITHGLVSLGWVGVAQENRRQDFRIRG